MVKKSALGVFTVVTRETQEKEGLVYTLSAVRVSPDVVMVNLEIPNQGKLRDIKRIGLQIGGGNGSPELYASLNTTSDKKDTWAVSFQLSPALANKTDLWLGPTLLSRPMLSHHYAVQLKGYIMERK